MQRGGSGGVVAAVMIGWRLLIFPVLVAFGVERCPLWIQSPNRLQKTNKKKQMSTLPLSLLNFPEGNSLVFVLINALIGLIKCLPEIRPMRKWRLFKSLDLPQILCF